MLQNASGMTGNFKKRLEMEAIFLKGHKIASKYLTWLEVADKGWK